MFALEKLLNDHKLGLTQKQKSDLRNILTKIKYGSMVEIGIDGNAIKKDLDRLFKSRSSEEYTDYLTAVVSKGFRVFVNEAGEHRIVLGKQIISD
ncbi:MAG: hypothetical protein J6X45_04465 [Lachnospiraceae bacterium]|nr:hypothetical protein [Lachnospiraceae bacterium]